MPVLGILSGKGGVGKTTLVSNLGATLSYYFNQNTLIVDGNVLTSHLGLHLGMYEEPQHTINDLLSGKVAINQCVYIHPISGVRILPAPLSVKKKVNLEKMKGFVKKFKDSYDVILFDTPPGLGRETISVVESVEQAVIITTPDIPAVTDALRCIKLLRKLKKDIKGIVVNRVRSKRYELTLDEIRSMCSVPIISTVPEDDKVPESISRGIPLVLYSKYSRASVDMKKLAASLLGEVYKQNFWEKMRMFFHI
jgi:septum site-determining protein MinD